MDFTQLKKAVKMRKMTQTDIDAVLSIEESVFKTPWTRKAFEEELSDNELACYLVLTIESEDTKTGLVIGYAGMWIIFDEAHVTNIALLPEYHGQGLGHILLKQLICQAKTLGADSMTLEVRPSNIAARRLYEKFNFKENGIRRNYYTDSNEDALILWKDSL